MNYIQYKQWADHWESLQQQAIDASLSDKDNTDEDDGEVIAIFLAVAICLLSFIIAMIISA
jgi:hypothetical protein